MLPGDWMRVNTIATIQSMPMIAPVRGRWKCSFDYYYNPWSNIYGYMDNNTRQSVQSIVSAYRYVMQLGAVKDAPTLLQLIPKLPKIARGGVLDFLGCPVGYLGRLTQTRTDGVANYYGRLTNHPAESFISYIDIIRNYYVNNQASSIPYINATDTVGYGYSSVSLQDMDDFIMKVRSNSNRALVSPEHIGALTTTYQSIDAFYNAARGFNPNYSAYPYGDFVMPSQAGLFLRSYRMDLLRGIMNSQVGTFNAKINTSGGNVTVDSINFYSKLQMLINRIDITGGRFSDWINTRWNVDAGIAVDRPIYLGSHSLWLNTIDVIATASGVNDVDNGNSNSSLGQQVGYQVGKMTTGKGKNRQRAITIKSKQYGTLMCIFSIVPDVVYSQGFELNMLKTKFADIYDPAFKQIGFQDVLQGELDAFPSVTVSSSTNPVINLFSTNDLQARVGKRIAWSEYMASLNRSHGDFAYGQSLDYWVNNRAYVSDDYPLTVGEIGDTEEAIEEFHRSPYARLFQRFDASTYVYPHLWNGSFADKNKQQMNYLIDVYFAIDANRSLGKRIMPHL